MTNQYTCFTHSEVSAYFSGSGFVEPCNKTHDTIEDAVKCCKSHDCKRVVCRIDDLHPTLPLSFTIVKTVEAACALTD